ncbi:hypothetical protein M378DRAFT_727681 [Amanita muscaria Koide BX008]|uniref:DUF6533 domain-containing protein n=1 Tax=Amanita muscaria (strain Koide BX008) TaxID=946122 RepID=A0A0C2WFD3_AMAMK|nr:hypothetical protein M378DRAFT_727681 [Amanita muscaria Koide BX008]
MSSPSFLDITERHRAVSYANVSAMALLIFDFFQTLDVEINYIWHSPWTVTKRSYLSMRCLQFIYVFVLLLGRWSHC